VTHISVSFHLPDMHATCMHCKRRWWWGEKDFSLRHLAVIGGADPREALVALRNRNLSKKTYAALKFAKSEGGCLSCLLPT